NTGSGKTTFLNALFSFIPMDERVIIAEETPEICILQQHRINLVTNQSLKISMADLVHNTLRMRPDRVIVGEVRSKEETLALMESLQAGQAKGCYATFHAQNSEECVNRLNGFGIPRDELSSIDLIVVLRRASMYDAGKKAHSEIRRVFEISEINGGKATPIFSYDARKDSLLFHQEAFRKSRIARKMAINYKMDADGIIAEMARRRNFIESLPISDANYSRFTEKVQEYMFGSRKLL
ncbi:MAG: ATPase, T2SS/T4P/T4SS family, partial [Candidatus Micrarchaeota archaeon]